MGIDSWGLLFIPLSFLLPNACNAEVKSETLVAATILDKAILHLRVIAKDGRAETYKGLGSLVIEPTTPALIPYSELVP